MDAAILYNNSEAVIMEELDSRTGYTRAETEGYMNIEELNDKSEEDWRIITEILRILKSGGNYRRVNFKTVNQRQIVEITNRINKILDKILTRTIAEMNNLINAVMIYVA